MTTVSRPHSKNSGGSAVSHESVIRRLLLCSFDADGAPGDRVSCSVSPKRQKEETGKGSPHPKRRSMSFHALSAKKPKDSAAAAAVAVSGDKNSGAKISTSTPLSRSVKTLRTPVRTDGEDGNHLSTARLPITAGAAAPHDSRTPVREAVIARTMGAANTERISNRAAREDDPSFRSPTRSAHSSSSSPKKLHPIESASPPSKAPQTKAKDRRSESVPFPGCFAGASPPRGSPPGRAKRPAAPQQPRASRPGSVVSLQGGSREDVLHEEEEGEGTLGINKTEQQMSPQENGGAQENGNGQRRFDAVSRTPKKPIAESIQFAKWENVSDKFHVLGSKKR